MSEEVAPNGFVFVFALLVFEGFVSGCHGAVGAFGIALDVKGGDEAAGVLVGRLRLIDIDDGAELMQPHQLPRALVVKFFPAHVFHVAESEEALVGSFGREGLPRLVLVTRSAEGDDASDFGVLGESGSRGGSVGGSGENDFFPEEIALVRVEKLLPLSGGVFFDEVFYEEKGAPLDAITNGDGGFIAVIFARGRFEAHVAPAMFGDGALLAAFRKPLAGVVDLNGVDSIGIDAVHQFLLRSHEPDRKTAFCWDTSIDTGVLEVLRFPFRVLQNKFNVRIGSGLGVNLAGTGFIFKMLSLGKEGGDEGEEEKGSGDHGKGDGRGGDGNFKRCDLWDRSRCA